MTRPQLGELLGRLETEEQGVLAVGYEGKCGPELGFEFGLFIHRSLFCHKITGSAAAVTLQFGDGLVSFTSCEAFSVEPIKHVGGVVGKTVTGGILANSAAGHDETWR